MKAVIKKDKTPQVMFYEDIILPPLAKDQVLIKVAYAGICGTDIHAYYGEYEKSNFPMIFGHEFSGVVVAVHNKEDQYLINKRICSETTLASCGTCIHCLNNELNLCEQRIGIGTRAFGAFAQYVITNVNSIHLLSDKISLLEGSLIEPLACGVHSVLEKSSVNQDSIVVVFGIGAIGLSVMQVAKASNATVIMCGLSRDEQRMALAKKLGCDYTINVEKNDLKTILQEAKLQDKISHVFECSGSSIAINTAIDIIMKKGQLVQLGVSSNKYLEINFNDIVQKEINIIGSRSQNKSSYIKAISLLENNLVNVKDMVSSKFALSDFEKAFAKAIAGDAIKVVFEPNLDEGGK